MLARLVYHPCMAEQKNPVATKTDRRGGLKGEEARKAVRTRQEQKRLERLAV